MPCAGIVVSTAGIVALCCRNGGSQTPDRWLNESQNTQSMLDEYKFALGVSGEEFVEAIKDAFLQTTTLPYVSQEYYRASFTDRPQSKAPRLRVHFAAGYFDAKTSDKTIQRVNNVRNAFMHSDIARQA